MRALADPTLTKPFTESTIPFYEVAKALESFFCPLNRKNHSLSLPCPVKILLKFLRELDDLHKGAHIHWICLALSEIYWHVGWTSMAPLELADVFERVSGSLYRWTPAMKLPCHGWNLLAYLRALADLYTSRHINGVLHFPYREYWRIWECCWPSHWQTHSLSLPFFMRHFLTWGTCWHWLVSTLAHLLCPPYSVRRFPTHLSVFAELGHSLSLLCAVRRLLIFSRALADLQTGGKIHWVWHALSISCGHIWESCLTFKWVTNRHIHCVVIPCKEHASFFEIKGWCPQPTKAGT